MSPEAQAEWDRVVPELHRMGLVGAMDRAPLVAYCDAWGLYCAAQADLRERGILIPGRDGGLVKNPSAQIMKASREAFMTIGAKFGLTPMDRQHLSVIEEPLPDDYGHLIK